MKCEKVQELLPLYIDNELETSLAKYVEEHLGTCSKCKSELALLDAILSDVQTSYPQIDVPEDFSAKLHNKLVDIKNEQADKTEKKRIGYNSIFRYSGLAACLVLLLMAVTYLSDYNDAFYEYMPDNMAGGPDSELTQMVPDFTQAPKSKAAPDEDGAQEQANDPTKPPSKPPKPPKSFARAALPEDMADDGEFVGEPAESKVEMPQEKQAEQNRSDLYTKPEEDSKRTASASGSYSDTPPETGPPSIEKQSGQESESEENAASPVPAIAGGGGGSGGAPGAAVSLYMETSLQKIEADNLPKVTYTMRITPNAEQKQAVTSFASSKMSSSGNQFLGDIHAYNAIKTYCINNTVRYLETKKDYAAEYKKLVLEYNTVIDEIETKGINAEREAKARTLKSSIDTIVSNTSVHYVIIQ